MLKSNNRCWVIWSLNGWLHPLTLILNWNAFIDNGWNLHSVVFIDNCQSSIWIPEFPVWFFIYLQVCESLEDLLQSSLCGRVFTDVEETLLSLDEREEESNCPISFWYSDLVVVVVMLKNFNLIEIFSKTFKNLNSTRFNVQPIYEVLDWYSSLVSISFEN